VLIRSFCRGTIGGCSQADALTISDLVSIVDSLTHSVRYHVGTVGLRFWCYQETPLTDQLPDVLGLHSGCFVRGGNCMRQTRRIGYIASGVALVLLTTRVCASGPSDQGTLPVLVPTLGVTGGGITAVTYSRDGQQFVSGGAQTAILWDAGTGGEIRRFENESPIVYVDILPNGRTVLTGATDGAVRFFDAVSGALLRKLEGRELLEMGHGTPYGRPFALSPNGDRVFLIARDGRGELRNPNTGELVGQRLDVPKGVGYAAFSPQGGKWLAIGSKDEVHVYTLPGGNSLWKKEGHSGPLAFSADGQRLITSSNDIAKVRDTKTGKEVATLEGHSVGIFSLAVSPDSRWVLTGSFDRTAKLWRSNGGPPVWSKLHASNVDGVCFHPNGQSCVTSDWEGNLIIRALESGRESGRFRGNLADVHYVGFGPNGPVVVAAGKDENAVSRFEGGREPGAANFIVDERKPFVLYWEPLATTHPIKLGGLLGRITSVQPSPDGRELVTGSEDLTASVWDLESLTERHRFEKHAQYVAGISFDPKGKIVATVGGSIYLWDRNSGRRVGEYPLDLLNTVLALRLFPDGIHAAVRHLESGVGVLDLNRHKEDWKKDGPYTGVSMSADGHWIAGPRADGEVSLFKAADGTEQHSLKGHKGDVLGTVFSRDGELILSGGEDGTARLWDRRAGRELEKYRHAGPVSHVAIASDNRFLLTSASNLVYLWKRGGKFPLCTLALFSDQSWLVADNEGRFDSNDLFRIQGAFWVMPDDRLRLLPVDLFARDYYEPNLFQRIIRGKKFEPVPGLGTKERVQPVIRITDIEPRLGSDPPQVNVTVEVEAQEVLPSVGGVRRLSGAQDLRLFREGRLVARHPAEGGPITLDPKTHRARVTFPAIALAADKGSNVEFVAYAFNDDRIKSNTARLSYLVREGKTPKGRGYVISIGVDRSDISQYNLHFAAADARALQDLLRKALKGTLAVTDVVFVPLIADKGGNSGQAGWPTKAAIKAVFNRLAGRPVSPEFARLLPPEASQVRPIGPNDFLIVTWSTHGGRSDDGRYYLAPTDITEPKFGATSEFLKSWISVEELSDWLRGVDPKLSVMIIDACYSAGSIDQAGFKPGPFDDAGFGQLAYDKGMQVLAASQTSGVALESEGIRHGYLTYALIAGLSDGLADTHPADGIITISKWLAYGADQVPVLLSGTGRGMTRQVKPVRFAAPDANLEPVQKPYLFDFRKTQIDLVLTGGDRFPFIELRSSGADADIDKELEAVKAIETPEARAAALRRLIWENPDSIQATVSRILLVKQLIDAKTPSRELVVATRNAASYLRRPELQAFRVGTYKLAAEALAARKEEPAAGLDFARKALDILPNRPGNRTARESLRKTIETLERVPTTTPTPTK
jgi:WD40 repeat protein